MILYISNIWSLFSDAWYDNDIVKLSEDYCVAYDNIEHSASLKDQILWNSLMPHVELQEPKICYTAEQVQVEIYMYHYVRETSWDAVWSVVYNNSVTPAVAREHYSHLAWLVSQDKVHISRLSELETYQTKNCFPHQRIIILTYDDGRWDNYNFVLPLAREFDIKANLGIVWNRIAFDEGSRIDSFMLDQEIRWMIDSWFFEVQSHSITHTDLQQKWRDAQRYEICESTKYLEKLYNIDINSIIYPMWLYNQTSIDVARDCGLTYGLTTIEWDNYRWDLESYPYQLSRTRVHKWDSGWDVYWR